MRFLFMYGADNELATFDADSLDHAIEMFVSWAPISANDEENRKSITEINFCSPIIGWEDEDAKGLFATGADGSWFGADDLDIVTVPGHLTDADEIEDFIVNHRGED